MQKVAEEWKAKDWKGASDSEKEDAIRSEVMIRLASLGEKKREAIMRSPPTPEEEQKTADWVEELMKALPEDELRGSDEEGVAFPHEEEEDEPTVVVPVKSLPESKGFRFVQSGLSEDPDQVIKSLMDLADGLAYDRFDASVIRYEVLSRTQDPMDIMTVLMAYVFVGNNPNNLTSKVKDEKVGKKVLQVVNRLRIVRTKENSKTLTLSRVAIAFSPVVYLIRQMLMEHSKLPTSGVDTTTPHLWQDVSLSALSVSMSKRNDIKDFLLKFNRVLMKSKEQKATTKTKEEDMDAQAVRFMDLSQANAQLDGLVYNWKPIEIPKDLQAMNFIKEAIQRASAGGSGASGYVEEL